MTHISYETAKRVKEFLEESAPEPVDCKYYREYKDNEGQIYGPSLTLETDRLYKETPAYQLHDLLSRAFCEAMATRRDKMVCVPGKTQGKKFING